MTKHWWNKLSIRWIVLITPMASFVMVLIFFAAFGYFQQRSLDQLMNLQERELSKANLIFSIENDIAQNHVKIYEHMRSAQGAVDEGEFYDASKPLLLEIHSLEERLQLYLNENSEDQEITPQLEQLLVELIFYRNNTTNANLMATVDFNLAQDLLRDSTEAYINLNNQFLEISHFIQNRLIDQMGSSHASARKRALTISLISMLGIGLLLAFAYFAAASMSRRFNQRVFVLKSLLGPVEMKAGSPRGNEIDVLATVTDRVHATFQELITTRNELKENEGRLRAIFNNVQDGIVTIDQFGKVESFNHAAESIFSYKLADIIGRDFSELMAEPGFEITNGKFKNKLIAGGNDLVNQTVEATGKRQDKSLVPLRISVSKMVLNNLKLFIVLIRDITNEKIQEEQIRRTQKMDALGKLTGGIAHDFNNILGVILGYTSLLRESLIKDKTLSKYADEINKAGERGSKLTGKLLSFSRQTSFEAVPLNINEVLLNMRLMLEKTLTARIKLTFDLQDNLWAVQVDRNDLEDSILNICINAMHAMNLDGEIKLQTRNRSLPARGDFVQLSIADTGVGMAEEVKSHIFDPFYTTKGEKGTGLGLSQVHGFVKRSDGFITVDSKPGSGSRFVLSFPRHLAEGVEVEESENGGTYAYDGTEKILVVDDEPALLALMEKLLSEHGYQIICADNGAMALAYLKDNSVDLVISDVVMPEMDGFKLMESIKPIRPGVKFLFISGYADQNGNQNSALPFQDILNKPVDPIKLLRWVRRLLDSTEHEVRNSFRSLPENI